MRADTGKIIFSDKGILTALITTVLIAIFTFSIYISTSNLEKENMRLKAVINEMNVLLEEFTNVKDSVESMERKIGLTGADSIVPALEQMLNNIGLKADVIKPVEKKKIKEFTEETAELEIKGTDLNTIVNLLYKIENSPIPFKIKDASIRTTFEDPALFIVSMNISIIGK